MEVRKQESNGRTIYIVEQPDSRELVFVCKIEKGEDGVFLTEVGLDGLDSEQMSYISNLIQQIERGEM